MSYWQSQSLRSAPISLLAKRRFRTVVTAGLSNTPLLAFQVKEAEMLVEKFSTVFKGEKVLEKITTVIAGQTTVEPDILDKQLKAITSGEEYNSLDELRSGFLDSVSSLWTSSVDSLTHFNPIDAANWIGALSEDFAERFAAWELSSLVALGERWLIWTPLVVLPMAWHMSKNRTPGNEVVTNQLIEAADAMEKQERVRKEIQRIKLRGLLTQEAEVTKTIPNFGSIQAIVKQLQDLGSTPDEIEGCWELLYASQELPIVSRFPGLQIIQLEQRISQHTDEQKLNAHNFATLRLPGVGAVKIDLEGVWSQVTNMVTFDKITTEIVEVLESPISWDVSKVTLPLFIPQSERWKLLYLDDEMRVIQVNEVTLHIFLRANKA